MSSIAMQMSLEQTGVHQRKLIVSVPVERFEKEWNDRLADYGKKRRVAGFRAGKVPAAIIKKHFGEEAKGQLLHDWVNEANRHIIKEQKLQLVDRPVLDIQNLDLAQGAAAFTLTFEVFPEIPERDITQFDFKKNKIEISEADIDERVDELRLRAATWEVTESPVETGLLAEIDLLGTLKEKGTVFQPQTTMTVLVGKSNTIPGFQEALMGLSANDEKTFVVPFPGDYGHADLAGAEGEFKVKVLSVKKPVLPEADLEFFKEIGIEAETVEACRDIVRKKILETALEQQSLSLKNKVFDAVVAKYTDLSIPPALLQKEIHAIEHQKKHEDPNHVHGADCDHVHDEHCQHEIDPAIQEEALKRVRLTLILQDYAKKQAIQPSQEELSREYVEFAMKMPNPYEIYQRLINDEGFRQYISTLIIEQRILDSLVSHVQETEVALSYKEFMEKLNSEV